MKLDSKFFTLPLLMCALSIAGLASAQSLSADLKKESSVLITGQAASPQSVKTLPKGNASTHGDAFAFDTQAVKSIENTLRCWQRGVMIVAEHGWKLTGEPARPIMVNSKNQKAYALNYDETFCLYIGY